MEKKVSIVIPSWFTPSQSGQSGEHETFWLAQECLKRLIEVTPKELYELIIIDNGSTLEITGDRKDKWLYPPEYWWYADILIRNKTNLGFGPACNQGFAQATGEYVICLNNDILVWEGWLETMIKDFGTCEKLEPPCGILMPALEKTHKDPKEALKLNAPDLSSNKGKFGIKAEFGSLWMIERDLLETLKYKDGFYFDPQFKMLFCEDRDLWMRVRREGYETYRTHNTRVYHRGNMSVSKIKDKNKYSTENKIKLHEKWPDRKIKT